MFLRQQPGGAGHLDLGSTFRGAPPSNFREVKIWSLPLSFYLLKNPHGDSSASTIPDTQRICKMSIAIDS